MGHCQPARWCVFDSRRGRENQSAVLHQGPQDREDWHGESVSEFEQAFHESIDSYLEACAKLDHEPDKPASGRLMLRVDPAIHAAALKAAKRSRTSLNQWAARVLADAAHASRPD